MNPRQMSDQDLLESTEKLARDERELLTKILHHLREIERRKLFSALGFKSLFDYAVKRLGYSGDQAMRRIAAMRLLKELPEIETKIESGALSLTNIGLAQVLFRKESLPREAKIELIGQLENKTAREAEKIIVAKSSNPIELKPDRIRVVANEKIELKFIADEKLNRKLERIRGLIAHSSPNCSLGELIEKICDIAIERLSPCERKRGISVRGRSSIENLKAQKEFRVRDKESFHPMERKRTYLPVELKREVWRRANGECQNCGSQYALQIDHIVPIAKGGTNEASNLRLLCRPCNLRAAIETLGWVKMAGYLGT